MSATADRVFGDLVVVLPGITGSVLEQDGREVWGFSAEVAWNVLRSRGESIRHLALDGDDPEAPDLGDGVRATKIIHRAHSLPALHKNIGYGPLVSALTEQLGLRAGDGDGSNAGNLFEFAYDWRRDNRASARALKWLIDDRLPAWREASGAADAKVVLVAHSMGGLVSRYYLECLGGREHCRALVTFGTPYGGAPNALEFLANGYKKLFVDLSDAMRSFTSVDQLLPRYPMLDVDGRLTRIADADGVPGVDRARARAASAFHGEIDAGVEEHTGERGYFIEPIVGMRQPTLQTARLHEGVCELSRAVPESWGPQLGDGDGTVPRISATPIELSNEFRETFIGERHSALQVNGGVLRQVTTKLVQMQLMGELPPLRAAPPAPQVAQAPALALDLDDAYAADEPIVVGVETVNYVEPITTITADLAPAGAPAETRRIALGWDGQRYTAVLDDLAPGTYAIRVESGAVFPAPAPPVHDLFEVVPRSES